MSKKLTFQEKYLKTLKRQKKSTNKHVWIALLILTLFIVGFEWLYSPSAPEAEQKEGSTFRASFVGDMMFGRHVTDVRDKNGTDYLFENVSPYFQSSDYVTGNFENAVTLGEEDAYTETDKAILLRSNEEPIEALKANNFTNINLANNHTMDYGEQGLLDTTASLKQSGLDYVGAGEDLGEAEAIDYQEINGMTVATLGVTDVTVPGFRALEFGAGVAVSDLDSVLPRVKEAEENADIVFVHIHWGAEYDNEPHPRQEEMAHAIVDAGADVIIGHHPHVLSPVEVYDDSVIFYSLGNFIFDQGWSRTRDSALVQYDLMEDGTGRFEINPMRIREARPSLTKNPYTQKKIFMQLTRGQPDDNYTEENGKLVIEVDHSDILKEQKAR